MVTQQTMAINSALAIVKASSNLAFSLRFFGINELLRVNDSGVYYTIFRLGDRVGYDADASLTRVSEDSDVADRSADESGELEFF